MSYDPNSYESRRDESPQAKMYREEAELEARDKAAALTLIASLTPADAQVELFSFAEIQAWGLKHVRKRAKPRESARNNDHEQDGA